MQEKPILRVGGLVLLLAFVLGFTFSTSLNPSSNSAALGWPYLLLGLFIFIVGFGDDLFGMSASLRLGMQISIGITAYLTGMRIEIFTNPFGGGSIDLGGFSLIATVFWFVAIPNLINLVDGMDGLAGGIGLFLSLILSTIGYLSGNPALTMMGLAMAGGLVAFLVFNLPPAKIYMGDGGAYLLGYFIAATSLITSNKGSIFSALLVVVIALGFPILDTFLAIVRRGLSGLPLMHADARHLHHRLMTLGFSKRTVLMLLYGIFLCLSLLGLSIFVSAGYTLPVAGMIMTIGILFAFRKLGLPHNWTEAKTQIRELLLVRQDVRYAYTIAQVLNHDLDRAEQSDWYWNELTQGLNKFGINPAAFSSDSEIICSENQCLLLFDLPGERIWRLCCQTPKGGKRALERIVRCFVPALLGGYEKWGTYPIDLGVLSKQAPKAKESKSVPEGRPNSDGTHEFEGPNMQNAENI